MTINGGIFLIQQVYNKQLSKTWPIIAPGVTTPINSLNIIDEGDSVVVNVGTTDFEGQTLYWTIQGVTGTIDSSDFTAISGSFTVEANNFGTFTITSTADSTTEGTESFVVQIRTDSISGPIKATSSTITINDTSISIQEYSWIAGNGSSTVERYSLTNDTDATSVRGPLDYSGTRATRSLGTTSFGWFGGGYVFPNTHLSNVSRIQYSNDTVTASSRGKLNRNVSFGGSTNNSNFGWFMGGSTAPNLATTSSVSRVEFSTDTATASSRGPITIARSFFNSAGNENFGWNIGGTSPSANVTRTDRVTYSTDTATATSRANLPVAFSGHSASAGTSFIWTFHSGGTTSNIYRLTMATDTSWSQRSTVPAITNNTCATENSSYSWIIGVNSTNINRYTHSDDTTQPVFRTNTLLGRTQSDATTAGQTS